MGHLGTLDPLATGVLPLIVGRATRLAQYFQRNDKRYEATIRFGVITDSYDRDGRVIEERDPGTLDRFEIDRVLDAYRGSFLQTPPPVSAKKVGGVAAYKLARKNIAVEIAPVEVTVFSLELMEVSEATARIRVHCTAGTYVRSIAHELGQRLGCGAILEDLRRTASGDFTIDQARRMDELEEMASMQRLHEALIPAAQLLPEMPSQVVDAITAGQIRQGRDFRVSPFRAFGNAALVKAITSDGELLAIGEARLPHVYHPVLVL